MSCGHIKRILPVERWQVNPRLCRVRIIAHHKTIEQTLKHPGIRHLDFTIRGKAEFIIILRF